MSIISTITLEKRKNHPMATTETIARVEFSREQYSVNIATADSMFGRMSDPREESYFREQQLREVAHQITAGVTREIHEALRRMDSVTRNGEAVTLRVSR